MPTIQVKVGQVGKQTLEFTLNGGATVQDLISAAALETEGYQIRVNGNVATNGTALSNGALVTLTHQVKAG